MFYDRIFQQFVNPKLQEAWIDYDQNWFNIWLGSIPQMQS